MSDIEAMQEKHRAKLEAEARAQRPEAARHVLWHNGDPRGQEPGSFTTKLLEAWTRADHENSARLAMAFPVLGTAVAISQMQGSDAVAEWAGLEPLARPDESAEQEGDE